MNPIEETQSVPNFMTSDYSASKLDKSNELNETMTIKPSAPDALESKIKGGLA